MRVASTGPEDHQSIQRDNSDKQTGCLPSFVFSNLVLNVQIVDIGRQEVPAGNTPRAEADGIRPLAQLVGRVSLQQQGPDDQAVASIDAEVVGHDQEGLGASSLPHIQHSLPAEVQQQDNTAVAGLAIAAETTTAAPFATSSEA